MIDAATPVAFFANGIGDAILALPALRALSQIFKDRLTLITHASALYKSLFKPLPTAHQLSIASGTKGDWDPEEIRVLAASINPCDLFISLVPWVSPSLRGLIEQLRPTKTIGYFKTFDVSIPLDYSKHTAELTFDTVRVIRPQTVLRDFLDPPAYPESSRSLAKEIRASLDPNVRILALHTETLPEKMWDPSRFSDVLDQFLSIHPEFLVVSVAYRSQSLTLKQPSNQGRLVALDCLPLDDALCLVNAADYFLGIDSCMLHAADLGRVPSVGLFGPTNVREFGFLAAPHIAIQAPSDLNRISVDCVVSALESLLLDTNQRTVWHL